MSNSINNSNFLILNTDKTKTTNNNLYNELFINKLKIFIQKNESLFSTWMIKNKNNSGIDYNTVHKEHMMDNYFVPLAYLIYSYAYITFQKNNKLKELILNNEYKFHIYNSYVFNYNNPIVKKVNVFIYTFYEKNLGNKGSKAQYFINELVDDSYTEKLISTLNRFIKLFDNEEQNILYEVYAKIKKLKDAIDAININGDTKLFDHLKSFDTINYFNDFYGTYKNINIQIIELYDIIHKLNIKNIYYLNGIFNINIMNLSQNSFNQFYESIENYVNYSNFIIKNIKETKDFLKNLILKIKEFKYFVIDLYNLLSSDKNNKNIRLSVNNGINRKIENFINEIKSIINNIENYKIVTKITGTIQNGKLRFNYPQPDKVFGNVGEYFTLNDVNYKIGKKDGSDFDLIPTPSKYGNNIELKIEIGKDNNFLSYTTLKNIFNKLITGVGIYLNFNINYINNLKGIRGNSNLQIYEIELLKNDIIKYYKLLNKNNKNESYYTKIQKTYNDYMANQIKEIESYRLDFKNNGRSNLREPVLRENNRRKKNSSETKIRIYEEDKNIITHTTNNNQIISIFRKYETYMTTNEKSEISTTLQTQPINYDYIKPILINFFDRKIIEEKQSTRHIENNLKTRKNKYNSDMLKKAKNEKFNIIITNTLKELEKIKTIQINDTKTNILNNSSIETNILSYIDFIQNMLKIFEERIYQINFHDETYKINKKLDDDGIIQLYESMKETNISHIFNDKKKYFIKDNPKSFLKTIDEIIEKNTNNKSFTDNIKLFFTKYKEYCNDVIKKIKNIMDKISTSELVFINKNTNNNDIKGYFSSLMLQLFSKRNLKLHKIINNITNHESRKLEGKYIAVFPYTDILFKYLIYLMNISDTLSINTSNNFYVK